MENVEWRNENVDDFQVIKIYQFLGNLQNFKNNYFFSRSRNYMNVINIGFVFRNEDNY